MADFTVVNLANVINAAEKLWLAIQGSDKKLVEKAMSGVQEHIDAYRRGEAEGLPVPMLLWCPQCRARHIDKGAFETKLHHTHACQSCGHVWRPAVVPTVGVRFLPGFKDEEVPDGG